MLAPARQSQIAEKQSVVDDQNLCAAGAARDLIIKAIVVGGAVAAHAVATVAFDFVPNAARGLEGKVGQRAIGGLLSPKRANFAKLLEFLVGVKQTVLNDLGRLSAAAG